MGDDHIAYVVPRAVLILVLETAIVGVLHALQPNAFWMGVGAALIVTGPIAALVWRSSKRIKREAEEAVKADVLAAKGRVEVAELQLAESKRATETREAGLELLHRAAEAVRRAVIANEELGGYSREQFRDDVRQLLETRLLSYLGARLGREVEYAVTIKWVHATGSKRRLISVFRDSKQGPKRRMDEGEDLDGNYFYEKLDAKEHIYSDLLCLVVHDTHLDEIPASLKNRARDRGYRSSIVIPLNLPLPEPLEGYGLVGFLSVDAPKPFIFTEFFGKLDEGREFGCQGQNHRRTHELNLLYGLADSIAAIYLLTKENGVDGK